MLRGIVVGSVAVLLPSAWVQAAAPSAKRPATPEGLLAEIESLKEGKVAWRGIAWKSCLLEGLKKSREEKKPVLLWVFIDRPTDDALLSVRRCRP
jgi:hypothetical protein